VVAYDLSRPKPAKVLDQVGDAYLIGIATAEGGDEILMVVSSAGDSELLPDIAHAVAHHARGEDA